MRHARIPMLLLAGFLLLSSCLPTAAPPPSGSAPDPAPPAVSSEPAPLESPPESLPPLEPFQLDEKYTRYYPETTLELIPRDDYGPIYPYLGGVTADDWGWYESSVYGFCTADGTILCDPSCYDVELHEYEGERVYTYRKTTQQGADGSKRHDYCLMAGDGRFSLTFEAVQDGGEGTFAVKRGGKWGSVDYAGKELLPCMYERVPTFSDGLALVCDAIEDGYWFVDRENRTALGPLPPPPLEELERIANGWEDQWIWESQLKTKLEGLGLHEGRAKFYQDGMYGYIDKTGAVVIPAIYSDGSTFQDGRAVVYAADSEKCVLIDLDGNEIISVDNGSIGTNEDGIWTVYDTENKRAWLIDSGGNVQLGPYEYDHTYYRSNRSGYFGGGWFYHYRGDEDAYTLLRDGVTYDVGGPFSIQLIGDDRFFARYQKDRQMNQIIDSSATVYFDDSEDRGHLHNLFDTCWTVGLGGLIGVIDLDGNEIIPIAYTSITPIGDHYLAKQGIYGGLLDASGEWVIKVSLLDFLED